LTGTFISDTIKKLQMTKAEITAYKYPIGKFQTPEKITPEMLYGYINDIETLPARLKTTVKRLTPEMLDTPYRPGGWTVRQVVHHFAHSHINAFIRLKLALTETNPVIKPYQEKKWVTLPDAKHADIALSIKLVENVHACWVVLLRQMKPRDFAKCYIHPEGNTVYRLDESTGLYAWHCNHHLAHIAALKKRMGWK
jgi:hypothetical protein